MINLGRNQPDVTTSKLSTDLSKKQDTGDYATQADLAKKQNTGDYTTKTYLTKELKDYQTLLEFILV